MFVYSRITFIFIFMYSRCSPAPLHLAPHSPALSAKVVALPMRLPCGQNVKTALRNA